MTTTADAETPHATRTGKTLYVVLEKDASGLWNELADTVAATNAADAVKKTAGDHEGRYVAIPARSWKPLNVTVETKTSVRIE